MKHITRTLLLLLCACLLCTVAFAVAEVEDNNSAAKAQPVEFGQTVEAEISTNDDFDFYKFTLPESGRLSIDVTSHMKWYTLTLYDADGKQLAYAKDKKWNGKI